MERTLLAGGPIRLLGVTALCGALGLAAASRLTARGKDRRRRASRGHRLIVALLRLISGGACASVAGLVLQGLLVLLRTPRLPEAPGPTSGRAVARDNDDRRRRKDYMQNLLRVVVAFGDSVAAGVGCPDNERAMAGSFGRACAAATGGDVVWHSVGRTGTTARTMCHPKQLASGRLSTRATRWTRSWSPWA